MSEKMSETKSKAEKPKSGKIRLESSNQDRKNQRSGDTTWSENTPHLKPGVDYSKTAVSTADDNDRNQNVLFGEHLDHCLDENSEYFSMLGEIGASSPTSLRATEMRLEDVEEIRKMFNVFDQDSNGVITANELRTIMSSLGQSTTEAEVMDMVNSIGTIRIY